MMNMEVWVFLAVGLLMANGQLDMSRGACLIQQRQTLDLGQMRPQGETCTPLNNEGSYFSVQLCVGTPPQCFDVVADTGSDSVIVPSCICAETPGAGCIQGETCFRGINKSSTFSIPQPTKEIALSFGSGTIQTAIATDIVSVGDLKKKLEGGVLLMVNRAALAIKGKFKGILGLGIPKDKSAKQYLIQVQESQAPYAREPDASNPLEIICRLAPWLCGGTTPINHPDWHPRPLRPHQQRPRGIVGEAYEPKLFLQEAKVDRFSMCFRDANKSGALRLGLPPFASPIRNIGQFHWGLDFRGLSVGSHDDPAPVETVFCGPETMRPGMVSPCGIIPDSGTTMITGPKEQLLALEKSICSKWDRCRRHSNGMPSSETFRQVLSKCGDWLTTGLGLLEIPSFFIHVQTAVGKLEVFELTAWAWVTEMTAQVEDGSIKKICYPSLGPMEYVTQNNGPVWIFGMPLFYEYNVGYDMSTKQISLQKGQCEPCLAEGKPVSLNDAGERRWPRASHGQPRIPYYDVDLPL